MVARHHLWRVARVPLEAGAPCQEFVDIVVHRTSIYLIYTASQWPRRPRAWPKRCCKGQIDPVDSVTEVINRVELALEAAEQEGDSATKLLSPMAQQAAPE
jgi:hypothetical protein